jgi:hypothetical protein
MLDIVAGWGYNGEQVCKVSKPYVNGLWKYLRHYKNFNISGHANTEADARVTTKLALLILIE